VVGLPLALVAAGGLGYGLFGAGTQPKASAATTLPAWATATADGFASVMEKYATSEGAGRQAAHHHPGDGEQP
jgi:hypothetical protein